MMREVLIFVSGVTIGGFLGYKIIEKKYNDKLETEVNRRIDEYVLNNKKEERHTEPMKIKKENIADKINYNNVTKNYISSEDNVEKEETKEEDDGKEDEPEVNDYISDDSSRDPYEITEEEYDDTSNEFEKESLYYYRGNYTLVDDSDNVVDTEDADILLGSDWLDLMMNENGIIYIRNEKVKTDYEIVVNSGVYPL